jgi:hypothetical protein
MDADLQDSPRNSRLYNMITSQNFGFRLEKKRYDSVVAKPTFKIIQLGS